MNVYGWIVLITLIGSYLLELASVLLNLSALEPELPDEFRGVYDPAAYRKSQEYTRVRARFGLVCETFFLLVTLAFWFLGGFNVLDKLVRGWDLGPVPAGLAYIGLLLGAKTVLSLPFSIYSTFIIEERFGFNQTTPATFIADRLKGLTLSLAFGAPLLAGLLYLLEHAGANAWLYCWGLVVAFSLFLQFIFPRWILPIFHRLRPLEEGDLRAAILRYAEAVRFPLRRVFVIDGSRRSGKSNAFFAGFGSQKLLALFDTLIEKHSIGELVAVVAHEVGHYKRKHIVKGMLISIAHSGVLLCLLSVFLHEPALFDAFYMDAPSIYAGLVFFSLLFAPIDFLLSIALNAFSRRNEYDADRFAAATIEDAEDMARALKKLSTDNLVNLTPHPFYVFLHASHPPMLDRIRAIRQTAAHAGPG